VKPDFTYSRCSHAANDGVFFGFRDNRDIVASATCVLRWQPEFD
jgi:hypothetical protein